MSSASLLAMLFSLAVGFLVDSSPTVSLVPGEAVAPGLQEAMLNSVCPSCSLAQMRRNSSSGGGQTDMVEAVKHHILSMLHLSARPNLTQPVPRAALLNAIKKLHVGRVAEDGSVEIQEEGPDAVAPTPPDPPSEMITFAEPGRSYSDHRLTLQGHLQKGVVIMVVSYELVKFVDCDSTTDFNCIKDTVCERLYKLIQKNPQSSKFVYRVPQPKSIDFTSTQFFTP